MAESWAWLVNQFEQTFITDNRWQYFAKGIVTTLEVTFLALILGVVIGVVIAVIRSAHDSQRGSKKGIGHVILAFFNAIAKLYLTVIRGTPVVVQLLIIYFVVFGSVKIDKVFVAIMAFGLNSGAYVAEIFRSGIMSIDLGQSEAGRSLGLNYTQTMSYIVIPQAIKNILPALGNELITLLKETSICGFIGLQDLTKGAMIVQSRTYAPFVPYLSIAVLYLALVLILSKLLSIFERRLRESDRR